MKALVQQGKGLVLILVKQTKKFAWVCIVMLKIVIFVNRKENFNLMPTIKMLTFQLNFVSKSYLIDLILLNLEKYL